LELLKGKDGSRWGKRKDVEEKSRKKNRKSEKRKREASISSGRKKNDHLEEEL